MKLLKMLGIAAVSLSVATSASAHHSAGAYDLKHSMTREVWFTKFVWENPHLYFDMHYTDANGKVVQWHLEAGPPIMFLRGGIKSSNFQKGVGTQVKMTWCPTFFNVRLGDAQLGYWHAIQFSDGSEIVEQDVLKRPRPPPGQC